MPSRSSLAALAAFCLLAVAASAAAGPAAARPPPQPLCAVCTDQLAESAADHGVSLTSGASRLDVRVFENGSSRWTARVAVGDDGADALAANASLRRAVVEDVYRHVADDRRALTTRMADGTLVVSYRVSGVAHQSAGTLLFDLFSDQANPAPLYGGAERVVLHAPEGYRVVNDPAGDARANATAVTWVDADSGGSYTNDVAYTYVAFVPADTAAGHARGQLAIALAVGSSVLPSAAPVGALSALSLGGAGAVLRRRYASRDAGTGTRFPALPLAVTAAVLGAAALLLGGVESVTFPGPLALAVPAALFLALGYGDRSDRWSRVAVATLAALPLFAAVGMGLDGSVHPYEASLLAAATVLSLLVGVPAFYAGRELRARRTGA